MPRGEERGPGALFGHAKRTRTLQRLREKDVRRERVRILWILRSEARQAREAAEAALHGRRLVREADFRHASAAHAEAARELAYAARLEGIVLLMLAGQPQ